MAERKTILAGHFDDLEQQYESSLLGMWTFLVTEIMFFGGLFLAYVAYRCAYPEAFAAGSRHLDVLLGTINTAVLLTSSLTMALAVHAAREEKRKALLGNLLATSALGLLFLAIKGWEYHHKFEENLLPGAGFSGEGPPRLELFFVLYFAMTGLHALHVFAGVGVLGFIFVQALRRRFSARYFTPVEATGLYWHFVDIVWVFLFPLLYLIG
jgi:cytochrome c oxidase subunit III